MKSTIMLMLLMISALAFGQEIKPVNSSTSGKADTIYSTPYIDGLSFLKVRSNKRESIFLSVTLHSTTAIEGQTGATFLLDNGRSINKHNATITVRPVQNSNRYIYSSLIELNEKDISLLSTHQVFRFRLYVYYNDVKQGEKLRDELLKLLARQ